MGRTTTSKRTTAATVTTTVVAAPSSPPLKRANTGRSSTRQRATASAVVAAASGISPPRPTTAALRRAASDAAALFVKLQIPQTIVGEVFVAGNGDCGQLGLGPSLTTKTRPGKLDYFADKHIVNNGRLYSWGCNDHMALGRDGEENEPGPVEGLDDVHVVEVACGDSISVALTETGSVYAWGTFRNKNGVFGFRPDIPIQSRPFLIPEIKYATQIAAGGNHVLAMTADGKIFTWGVGESGQLCRRILPRSERESSLIPRNITFQVPRGTASGGGFERAWCGGDSTWVLLKSGAIFGAGLNNHGQLGVGDHKDGEIPRLLKLDGPEGVQEISASSHHSILLDKSGKVFVFGRNDDGQLGLGDGERRESPTLLPSPTGVTQVAANSSFTVALTDPSEGNNMYVWGFGEMGQLAVGNDTEVELVPRQVELKGRKVLRIGAGSQHTVMLLRPKDD
ncbi:regulator of chromosome condensation 1/beta-lactamase-inhibitor protein II [Zopfochytrium polystomum]|nr:regulator of chromosome condensation 1/beta-lactamase-inhibitor protein II [Zopfochytrium polystomum]